MKKITIYIKEMELANNRWNLFFGIIKAFFKRDKVVFTNTRMGLTEENAINLRDSINKQLGV